MAQATPDSIQNSLNMTLNPRQIKIAMRAADEVHDSLMIWGPPGIGKSNVSRQYADEFYPLRKDNLHKIKYFKDIIESTDSSSEERQAATAHLNKLESRLLDQEFNFIDFRLSQIEPSDLRGIPIPVKFYLDEDGNQILESELHNYPKYTTETSVVWAPPKVLKLSKHWKGVIIFDEINSAMPIVQAASYQLILDRRVGEMILPDGAFILAAGNRDGDGGVTFPLATPLRDRMTHVEMKPDLDQYIEDYAIPYNMSPAVISFLKEAPGQFNTLSPNDPSHSGGTSPRSWERVSDYVIKHPNMDSNIFLTLIAGRVGDGVAIEFNEYYQNIGKLPSSESILTGQVTKLDDNVDISSHYFLMLSLTMNLIKINRLYSSGKMERDSYCIQARNYLNFISSTWNDKQDELCILAIRTLTNEGVIIKYADVPEYRTFANKYTELVRKVRTM